MILYRRSRKGDRMDDGNEETQKSVGQEHGNTEAESADRVEFHYVKSNLFRVVHVDGVHGGPTPKGNAIQLAYFSERRPIPQSETYELRERKLAKRVNVCQRNAVIREVEVEAVIGLDVAKSIYQWLGTHIEICEKNLRADEPNE